MLLFITLFGLLTGRFITIQPHWIRIKTNSIFISFLVFIITYLFCIDTGKLRQFQTNQVNNLIGILSSQTAIAAIKRIPSIFTIITNTTCTALANTEFTIYSFITAITALNETYYCILFELYYYCTVSIIWKHCNIFIQSISIIFRVFGLLTVAVINIEVFGLESSQIGYLLVILALLLLICIVSKCGSVESKQTIHFISILSSQTYFITINWIGSLFATTTDTTTLANIGFIIYSFITAITALNESYYCISFKLLMLIHFINIVCNKTSIGFIIGIITTIQIIIINIAHNDANVFISWILYLFIWIAFLSIVLQSNISSVYPIFWITASKRMLFVLFICILFLWFLSCNV